MKFVRSSYFPALVLVVVAVILGIINYQDYGMSWDEPAQLDIGNINYDYVFKGNRETLDNFVNKDYGPAFELVLISIQKALNIESWRDIFLMRHIACHIFFIIGCLFAYLLIFRMYKSSLLASLGFLVVYLLPRFYAHSYFNSKDIVFLSLFFVSFWGIYLAFEKKKLGWFVLAGVLCGYTTSIRILGAILPAATGLVLLLQLIASLRAKEKNAGSILGRLVVFSMFAAGATILFWPLLWTSPVTNFIESYQRMAHFRWDGWMLVNGMKMRSTELPLTYFPIWFGVTVPLLWIALGLTGMVLFVIRLIKRPTFWLDDAKESIHFVFFLSVFIPVAVVILTRAVVYDDWRHLYFIYAGFSMFVIYAIDEMSATRLKIPVIALSFLQLGVLGWFMIKNHPYQQLYFNELVSRKPEFIRNNYEMDYWGASTMQGLEFILAHDTSSSIKVTGPGGQLAPLAYNILFLPDHLQRRIARVEETDSTANYFIDFFRYIPEDKPGQIPVYDIRVLNSTILRVSTPGTK